MKWKSVLFSDLRKKLGNQIVGTSWKGRGVFRKYVVPANPRTCAQQANRDHHAKVVALYQSYVGGEDQKKARWDTDALPRSISGFNLFQKLAMSSRILCDEVSNTGSPINGTYTVKVDISTAGLYAYRVGTMEFHEVIAIGEMEAGPDIPWEWDGPEPDAADTYWFYIVDGRSKTIPPTDAQREACHNHWDIDPTVECEAFPAINVRSAA